MVEVAVVVVAVVVAVVAVVVVVVVVVMMVVVVAVVVVVVVGCCHCSSRFRILLVCFITTSEVSFSSFRIAAAVSVLGFPGCSDPELSRDRGFRSEP